MLPLKALVSTVIVVLLASIVSPVAAPQAVLAADSSTDWVGLHVNRIRILEENWADYPDGEHPPAEMVCYMVAYLESGFTALLTYPDNGVLSATVGDVVNTGEVGLSLRVPKRLDELNVSIICVDQDQDDGRFAVGQRSFEYFLLKGGEEIVSTAVGANYEDSMVQLAGTAIPGWGALAMQAVFVIGHVMWDWMHENDLMGETLITLTRQDNWLADGKERTYKSTNNALEFVVEVRPSLDPTVENDPLLSDKYYQVGSQWEAVYYNNKELSGAPALIWSEDAVDFQWASTSPAVGLVNTDGFSARWLRSIGDLPAGIYRFTLRADDGARLTLNNKLFIDEWHNQNQLYMKDFEHKGGPLKIMLEYYDDSGGAAAKLSWQPVSADMGDKWKGVYYNNASLSGTPTLIRSDTKIDFMWESGIPEYYLGPSNYSVRWTRSVDLEKGSYRFTIKGDDGVRLYLNDKLFLDGWRDQSQRTFIKDYDHIGGPLSLRFEYYNDYGEGVAQLNWTTLKVVKTQEYWVGEYFNHDTREVAPSFVRNDKEINFDWGEGSPNAAIDKDKFYVRWTKTVVLDPGTYRFVVLSDDGAQLTIGSKVLIKVWRSHRLQTYMQDYRHVGGPVDIQLDYYEDSGNALVYLDWEAVDESRKDVWYAQYFDNDELQGYPSLIRTDPEIKFSWDEGIPRNGIGPTYFSARWTRTIDLAKGTYQFTLRGNDGVRLFVNDKLLINGWRDQSGRQYVKLLEHKGGPIKLRLEYYNGLGDGFVTLWWQPYNLAIGSDSWYGVYYNGDIAKEAPSLIREDREISFNWGEESPSSVIDDDNFYVEWIRYIPLTPGLYRFHVVADDGVLLYIDSSLLIDGWQSNAYWPLVGEYRQRTNGTVEVVLEYYEDNGNAGVELIWEKVNEDSTSEQWRAEYFNNQSLAGAPALIRNDPKIDFNWAAGSPARDVKSDSFSVRWTRVLQLEKGQYVFSARSDDGIRVYLERDLIIDEWRGQDGKQTHSITVNHAGGPLRVEVQYYEGSGDALVGFTIKRMQK